MSLQPSITQERVLWFVAMLLAFVTLRERFAERRRRRVYLWGIFGNCGLLTVYALIDLQFGNGRLYWVRPLLTGAEPFGPYINPNNFAGLMELVVPAIAGFGWTRVRRGGWNALGEVPFLAAVVLGGLCLTGGVTSASKAGAFLMAASLFSLGVLGARSRRVRLSLVGVGLLVAVLTPFLLESLRTTTRLGERVDSWIARTEPGQLLEGRVVAWQGGLAMVRDFPLTGVGFGAFREAFYRYEPPGASKRWDELHNDYLELLVDGGFVAGALVAWLMVAYSFRLGSSLRRGGRLASPGRLGLALGIAALAVHATLEFNHQIPANALTFVALSALVLPASASDRTRSATSVSSDPEGED